MESVLSFEYRNIVYSDGYLCRCEFKKVIRLLIDDPVPEQVTIFLPFFSVNEHGRQQKLCCCSVFLQFGQKHLSI